MVLHVRLYTLWPPFFQEFLGVELSEEQLERAFRKVDTDKSGSISYKEFKQMWMRVRRVPPLVLPSSLA